MKKHLLLYAVAVTALFVGTYRRHHAENRRLTQNQTALAAQVTHYRTRLGAEAASVQALRLRCSEFESLRAADAEAIRALGIKIRRLEAAAKAVAATDLEIRTPLHKEAPTRMCDRPPVGDTAQMFRERDAIPAHDLIALRKRDPAPVNDHARVFRWHDAWVSVEGRIARDSLVCRVRSVDTLRQVVHRIPRRFLFIRWGTKALRQEIVSTNPHTRIVYTEYVKLER